jgi:hypothetical protein
VGGETGGGKQLFYLFILLNIADCRRGDHGLSTLHIHPLLALLFKMAVVEGKASL